MNRRKFLQFIATAIAGLAIDPEEFLWKPSRSIVFVPHPKQLEFFNQTEQISLYGIPYHSNVSAGSWLGLHRGHLIVDEVTQLLKVSNNGR